MKIPLDELYIGVYVTVDVKVFSFVEYSAVDDTYVVPFTLLYIVEVVPLYNVVFAVAEIST